MRITIEINDDSGTPTVTTTSAVTEATAAVSPGSATANAIDAGPAPIDDAIGRTAALSAANTLSASGDGLDAGPAPTLP